MHVQWVELLFILYDVDRLADEILTICVSKNYIYRSQPPIYLDQMKNYYGVSLL